ncbi:hypothetical protein [Pseudobacteroides cellulosolvens]|uniref:hypothetical protein n=1 Tax=Pseudobacteroides cellulosolvens TaxID=35825 RepID=UPI001A9A63EF|nr:hypothetical protein [Pseudobacteroides cellulosolvens]
MEILPSKTSIQERFDVKEQLSSNTLMRINLHGGILRFLMEIKTTNLYTVSNNQVAEKTI